MHTPFIYSVASFILWMMFCWTCGADFNERRFEYGLLFLIGLAIGWGVFYRYKTHYYFSKNITERTLQELWEKSGSRREFWNLLYTRALEEVRREKK